MKRGLTILLVLVLTVVSSYACVSPTDDFFVQENGNYEICSGNFNLNGDSVFLINGSNSLVTCQGTVINYTGTNPESKGTNQMIGSANNITIKGCTFKNYGYGMYLGGGSITNLVFDSIKAYNNRIGLYSSGTNFNTIKNSEIYNSTEQAIYGSGASNFIVIDNIMIDVGWNLTQDYMYTSCVYATGNSHKYIFNNTITNCGNPSCTGINCAAIDVSGSTNSTTKQNRITNSRMGIWLGGTTAPTRVEGNIINDIVLYGIYLGGGNYVNITNNILNGLSSSIGIYLSGSSDTQIIDNEIDGTNNGVESSGGSYMYVKNNMISNTNKAIRTTSSAFNVFSTNTFTSNGEDMDIQNVGSLHTFEFGAGLSVLSVKANYFNGNIGPYISSGNNYVSINASQYSQLNKSANLSFALSGETCPVSVYYLNQYSTSAGDIIQNGQICDGTSNPPCRNIVCNAGTNVVTFNVDHFDSYGVDGVDTTVPEFNIFTIIMIMVVTLFAISIIRKNNNE